MKFDTGDKVIVSFKATVTECGINSVEVEDSDGESYLFDTDGKYKIDGFKLKKPKIKSGWYFCVVDAVNNPTRAVYRKSDGWYSGGEPGSTKLQDSYVVTVVSPIDYPKV